MIAMPAFSQERLLAQYIADIGPEDHLNSEGEKLDSFAALLAQDRANYHRFSIRHGDDEGDPIFFSRQMRDQISPEIVQVPSIYKQYVENVLASDGSNGTYLVVYVFGSPNRISRITIDVPG